MLIDPARGAKIEGLVRTAYQYAVRDRCLDEAEIDWLEVAINEQVKILIFEACLKNRVPLSEQGIVTFSRAAAILNCCLQELKIDNPYCGRPN